MKAPAKFLTPILLAAALLLPSSPAYAASVAAPTGIVQVSANKLSVGDKCNTKDDEGVNEDLLADHRWQESGSGLHSRLDNATVLGVDLGTSAKGVSRDVAGGLMGGGAALWGWTTGLVNGSVSFCAPAAVYQSVDKAAGSIGSIFTGEGGTISLLGIFFAITLIGSIFVAYRQKRFPLKDLVSKIVASALLMVMVSGALASEVKNDVFKPGFMSPGWFATTLTNTISQVGEAPASALSKATIENKSLGDKEKSWCDAYVTAMHNAYAKQAKASKSNATIPLAMAEMWTSTGGQTWADAQYGSAGSGSQYADNAWCMHLELRREKPAFMGKIYELERFFNSGKDGEDGGAPIPILVEVKEKTAEEKAAEAKKKADKAAAEAKMTEAEKKEAAEILKAERKKKADERARKLMDSMKNPVLDEMWGSNSPAYKATWSGFANGSLAFYARSNEEIDKSVVAWATCGFKGIKDPAEASELDLASKDSWFVRGGAGKRITPEACADWWSGKDKELSAFNWPTGVKAIDKQAGDDQTSTDFVQFVKYLHGETNDASVDGALTYLISSFVLLIVFGILSLGVFVALIALMFVSLAILLSVIRWALPFTTGGLKNLAKTFKALLGLSLVALAVVGLFSFIALLTRVIQTLGSGIGGANFQAIWTGLSPVVACVVLHMLFTKALKKPSPFSLSGATAWTQTLSGAGGAAGLSGLSSLAGRMDNAAGNRGRDAMERIPGISRGKDMMYKAGLTKAGSRRGAQAAADPEKRAAKAAALAMQEAGMAPVADRPGASHGQVQGGGAGSVAGSEKGGKAGTQTRHGSSEESVEHDKAKVSGLLDGGGLNERGELEVPAEVDPHKDVEMFAPREGVDPLKTAKNAKAEELRIDQLSEKIEIDQVSRADDRASAFVGKDARQTHMGQNLLANIQNVDVANSELAEVAVGSKQKEVAAKVALIEREQAKRWAKEEATAEKLHRKTQIKQGINPETGEEMTKREIPNMRNRTKDLMSSQWSDLKKRPVRTIARNAAIGAAATVTLAAVAPAAVVAAPLAILAPSAVNAARKRMNSVRRSMALHKDNKSVAGQDRMVANYRRAVRSDDQQAQAERENLMERQRLVRQHREAAEAAVNQRTTQASADLKMREAEASRQMANAGDNVPENERPAIINGDVAPREFQPEQRRNAEPAQPAHYVDESMPVDVPQRRAESRRPQPTLNGDVPGQPKLPVNPRVQGTGQGPTERQGKVVPEQPAQERADRTNDAEPQPRPRGGHRAPDAPIPGQPQPTRPTPVKTPEVRAGQPDLIQPKPEQLKAPEIRSGQPDLIQPKAPEVPAGQQRRVDPRPVPVKAPEVREEPKRVETPVEPPVLKRPRNAEPAPSRNANQERIEQAKRMNPTNSERPDNWPNLGR